MNALLRSACCLVVLAARIPTATGEPVRFGHGKYIYQVAFSPDGKRVVTDNHVWDVTTGKQTYTLPDFPVVGPSNHYFWVSFSPDGKHVAVHRYSDIVLVDAATGKQVWKAELPPRGNTHFDIPRVEFTPDGKLLVAGRNDEGLIRVFDTATGKEVRQFPYERNVGGLMGAKILSLGTSADGKRVIVHHHNDGPDVFDLATGQVLARHRDSTVKDFVHFSVVSADGRWVAFAHAGRVHLLDLQTGKDVRRFEADGNLGPIAFSRDGKRVAAVIAAEGKDDRVQCWDVETGKTIRILTGHKGDVRSLAFSPDGSLLLTGGRDGIARLWRLNE